MKRYLSLILMFLLVMSFVSSAWGNCEHSFDKWTNPQLVSDATCTEAARYQYSCTECSATDNIISVGNPLGHSWEQATCTDPKTCTRCHVTEGAALGHDWSQATCTKPKTCTRCKTTEGTALGHDFSIYLSVVEPATSENNAKGLYKCSRCDAQDIKEIPGTRLQSSPANSPQSDPEHGSCELTLVAYPSTMGTVEGAGDYAYASVAKAIATPNEGYKFTGWTDQNGKSVGTSSDRVLNIEMNSDLTYVAHFSENSSPTPTGSYQVTGVSDPLGIAILGGLGTHSAGTFVTLTANPSIDSGYIFSHWNLVGAENYNALTNPTTFVMPENNVAATAVYTKVQSEFKITYAPGENAKETTVLYQQKYRDVPVTLYMNQYTRDGYVQNGWQTAAGVKYNLGAQYTANADLTLYPTWGIPGQHNLTVKFNENGKDKVHTGNAVVVSGTVYPLKDDGSATFKFDTVDDIYPYNVKLNGVSKGSMDQIVVYGQAYDQILEIDFESIYTKPKTGDDFNLFLWTALGIGAFACGALSFALVRKKYEE